MNIKPILTIALASGIAFSTPARAQGTNNLGGLFATIIVGCILGGCNAATPTRPRPQRQIDYQVLADQKALNYFGFRAGGEDGMSGKNTRAAINRYQSFMGQPQTGALVQYQRQNLSSALQWARSGQTSRYPAIAGQSLLAAYNTQLRGEGQCETTNQCPDIPGKEKQPDPKAVTRSVTQFCETVALITSANGGKVISPRNSSTGEQAMSEQFCASRSYAIAVSLQIVSGRNISDAALAKSCEMLVNDMKPGLDGLGFKSSKDLSKIAQRLAVASAQDANFQRRKSQICLGYGYRTDNSKIVLASSLMLVGIGEAPYSEIFGHHIRGGFGTAKNADFAKQWFGAAFDSLDGGAIPAFLPTQSSRRVLIMKSALAIS